MNTLYVSTSCTLLIKRNML